MTCIGIYQQTLCDEKGPILWDGYAISVHASASRPPSFVSPDIWTGYGEVGLWNDLVASRERAILGCCLDDPEKFRLYWRIVEFRAGRQVRRAHD